MFCHFICPLNPFLHKREIENAPLPNRCFDHPWDHSCKAHFGTVSWVQHNQENLFMGRRNSMGREKLHYGWVVIFMGLLTTIAAHGFGRMAYTIILPAMKDGLQFDYTQLGLLGTGNFIGYLTMAIIGGFLAARFGTRIVITLALVLMGITMVLTGLAESFGFAFGMRLMTGLGNGAAYVPAMALGSAWFSVKTGVCHGHRFRGHRRGNPHQRAGGAPHPSGLRPGGVAHVLVYSGWRRAGDLGGGLSLCSQPPGGKGPPCPSVFGKRSGATAASKTGKQGLLP
jgi:hypothetical protein